MASSMLEKISEKTVEAKLQKSKTTIISTAANYLDKGLVWISILVGAALTLNMIIAVLFRYVLNSPIFWADELSLYLFCWVTFLGGSLAVRRSDMAAVTILFDRLPAQFKRGLAVFIEVSIVFFSSVIAYYSYKWVSSPSVMNQVSPTIPIKLWILYSIVPISMLCIIIFSIDKIIQFITTGIVEKEEETSS